MVNNADLLGATVTVNNDSRITRVGARLRHLRLDELPQLLDVIVGDMSFVGTRPEAVKYVKGYRPEYYATLLLPAGITSEASIHYRTEDQFLGIDKNIDVTYVEKLIPKKMAWNLRAVRNFSFLNDIRTMLYTPLVVLLEQ